MSIGVQGAGSQVVDPSSRVGYSSELLKSHVFIRVAVPVPSLDLLTYRVPDRHAAPAVGARVVVPLGTRIGHRHRGRRRRAVGDLPDADVKPIRRGARLPSRSFRPTSWSWRAGRPSTTPPAPARRSPRCCRRRREASAPMRTRPCASRRSPPAGHRRRSERGDGHRRASARRSSSLAGVARLASPTAELAARGISADAIARLAKHGRSSACARSASIAIRSTPRAFDAAAAGSPHAG